MPACTTMLSYDFSSNRGEEQAYIKRNAGKKMDRMTHPKRGEELFSDEDD
jgi:hypothetical protein